MSTWIALCLSKSYLRFSTRDCLRRASTFQNTHLSRRWFGASDVCGVYSLRSSTDHASRPACGRSVTRFIFASSNPSRFALKVSRVYSHIVVSPSKYSYIRRPCPYSSAPAEIGDTPVVHSTALLCRTRSAALRVSSMNQVSCDRDRMKGNFRGTLRTTISAVHPVNGGVAVMRAIEFTKGESRAHGKIRGNTPLSVRL